MSKRDQSQEALRQVEEITDSKPVRGEALLRSRKLETPACGCETKGKPPKEPLSWQLKK